MQLIEFKREIKTSQIRANSRDTYLIFWLVKIKIISILDMVRYKIRGSSCT